MEEEHIVDDGEMLKDDDLMSDSQFSGNGNETSDSTNRTDKQFLVQQKRTHLTAIDDLNDNMKDQYIETTGVDPLNLAQICVPVDGDNVSWMGLSS